MTDAARFDAQFDVIFGRVCRCEAPHAGGGPCGQKAEQVTSAGAMCTACAYCYWQDELPPAPQPGSIEIRFGLRWIGPRGAQAGR